MKTSANVFSGFVQRWTLGILLGLSISLCAIPEQAEAKGNTVEKTTSSKKADKKISKEKKRAKKSAKATGKDNKKKSSSKKAAKDAKKVSKKKSSGKSASKSKSAKSSKVAKKADKAKPANRSSKKATKRQQRQDQYVWTPSSEPKQAYYIMPTASGAASKATQPAQPVPFPADNTRQQQQADNKAKAYQVGTASYYGNAFHGKKTASGERFDQDNLTCAHGSLPFGCKIRVTNLRNKKSVEVKVNDRGGFQKHGRVIDLSKAAAKEIGMLNTGTAKVQIEVLE